MWTGENVTSGREHFWKRRKKVAFSNEYGYVWTGPEWSPIRSVIMVINKIRGSPTCFIMSMITNRIGQDEVRLPIHHNYNKICDILASSSIIKTRNSKSFFLLAVKKKPFKRTHAMMRTLLLHCPISAEIRTVDSQSDLRILL